MFKYGWRFELGMLVGKPGDILVDRAMSINDKYPRNYATAILLWVALPLLNLRNRINRIKN